MLGVWFSRLLRRSIEWLDAWWQSPSLAYRPSRQTSRVSDEWLLETATKSGRRAWDGVVWEWPLTRGGTGMGINRHAARRDANEAEIVAALERIGCRVLRLKEVDLLVCRRDELYLLEIKTRTGRVTASQQKLIDDGWPLAVVRSIPEAISAVSRRGPRGTDPRDDRIQGGGGDSR